MNNRIYSVLAVFFVLFLLSPLGAAGVKEEAKADDSFSVLVFVPGVAAGSPPYETMVAGANEFAQDKENVSVKVYEAGFNQAQWEQQLTSLVATGEYDVVLSTNPSLPEICERVGEKFPDQKFIITDAYAEGNDQMRTYLYNQYEQSLYLGYLAGLVTASDMEFANENLKIGFIASQEYPLLNNHILPGFLDGARLVNKDIELDFRVIGNWFDANKASDLASSMIDGGVDIFAVIAGGAAQGVFKTVTQKGAYVVFHDKNEYSAAPGYVVGSGSMEQKKLVMEILSDVVNGTVEYGKATVVGLEEGYIGFHFEDPLYVSSLPQDIRDEFASFMERLRNGSISYTLPVL
ncbi:MAG: BMP family ABC transporter substrate-binding protein [Sphaerochaetaceae bacterium]|nr:BMP family ABC transporter substrate-binding protein [Sphaerochaetaceae bacterium]